MHSITRTQKILTFMSCTGECQQQKHTQHAPSMKMECDYLYRWTNKQSPTSPKKRSYTQKSHPKWGTPEMYLGMQKKKKLWQTMLPQLCSPGWRKAEWTKEESDASSALESCAAGEAVGGGGGSQEEQLETTVLSFHPLRQHHSLRSFSKECWRRRRSFLSEKEWFLCKQISVGLFQGQPLGKLWGTGAQLIWAILIQTLQCPIELKVNWEALCASCFSYVLFSVVYL